MDRFHTFKNINNEEIKVLVSGAFRSWCCAKCKKELIKREVEKINNYAVCKKCYINYLAKKQSSSKLKNII